MEEKYLGYTPDYIDTLLPKQVFVFGSNALGYHTGGASGTARKKFGAVRCEEIKIDTEHCNGYIAYMAEFAEHSIVEIN